MFYQSASFSESDKKADNGNQVLDKLSIQGLRAFRNKWNAEKTQKAQS